MLLKDRQHVIGADVCQVNRGRGGCRVGGTAVAPGSGWRCWCWWGVGVAVGVAVVGLPTGRARSFWRRATSLRRNHIVQGGRVSLACGSSKTPNQFRGQKIRPPRQASSSTPPNTARGNFLIRRAESSFVYLMSKCLLEARVVPGKATCRPTAGQTQPARNRPGPQQHAVQPVQCRLSG